MILKHNFDSNINATLFREIVISRTHRDPNKEGFFSQAIAENIRARILDPNDIGAWFDGKINSSMVRIVENYSAPWNDNLTGASSQHYGRIIVYSEVDIGGFGLARDFDRDGYIDLVEVRLGVSINGELLSHSTITHEIGHGVGLQGHATPSGFDSELTVMRRGSRPDLGKEPRFADRKTAKVLYEDTYIHREGTNEDGKMRLRDILGFGWFN